MYSLILEKNKLLNQNQFGPRQNHLTLHALINRTEAIKRQLDGINLWLEFSMMWNKLKHYGFRGKINELILSFLSMVMIPLNGQSNLVFHKALL